MSAWMRRGQPSRHSKEWQKIVRHARRVKRDRMRKVRFWQLTKRFYGWRRHEFRCSTCYYKRKNCETLGCRATMDYLKGKGVVRGADNGPYCKKDGRTEGTGKQ